MKHEQRLPWSTKLLLIVLGLYIAIVFIGCGPSQQKIDAMNPVQLVPAHFREIDIMGKADMRIVNELVERGGLSESARTEYVNGARLHQWRTPYQWGLHLDTAFDWQRMGYGSFNDYIVAAQTHQGSPDVIVYGSHGRTTLTNYGNGMFRVGR